MNAERDRAAARPPVPTGLREFVRVCVAVSDIRVLTRFFFSHKIGQKHSRLGRERVARFRYSLFFPISTSASSSTGRAEAQITVLEEGLLAPPPPPSFEKGGRKLFCDFHH